MTHNMRQCVLPQANTRFAGVFFDPSLNRLGSIAFTGVLTGDNNRGVFTVDRGGDITDVAVDRDARDLATQALLRQKEAAHAAAGEVDGTASHGTGG